MPSSPVPVGTLGGTTPYAPPAAPSMAPSPNLTRLVLAVMVAGIGVEIVAKIDRRAAYYLVIVLLLTVMVSYVGSQLGANWSAFFDALLNPPTPQPQSLVSPSASGKSGFAPGAGMAGGGSGGGGGGSW